MIFLLGVPVLNYFAYSNQIGAIDILEKDWTDFCNATSWNNPADIICSFNNSFIANNDTFWYPIGYDLFGRTPPASFEPSVKDWKLERTWGNGWTEIDMTKPCNSTRCGKGKLPVLYSIVWRKGKTYETRVLAIKNNPEDAIYWTFGKDDPIWFGVDVQLLKSCNQLINNISIKGTCQQNHTFTLTRKAKPHVVKFRVTAAIMPPV